MLNIIDTHLHIWDLDKFDLPWLEDFNTLDKSFLYSDYKNSLGEIKVDASIYVEVDASSSQKDLEIKYITSLCNDTSNNIKGFIASGDLLDPNFKECLDKYLNNPYLKGFRHVLHVPSSLPKTCLDPIFVENVNLLGSHDLIFEVCMRTNELDDAYELAKLCGNTKLIIDHLGNIDCSLLKKDFLTSEEINQRESWKKNMKNLSSLDNVICKISGLNPSGDWDYTDLQPAVEYCFENFDENRLIFGSNYPVCNISTNLQPWIYSMIKITEDKSSDFKNKFFFENAKSIYNL